ncbi:MAG TPA: gliding motility-associated protein GldE [Bacteroidia bacterium]|nr:gliding motility-associated protein GldE [Bacteroidia bacterium]
MNLHLLNTFLIFSSRFFEFGTLTAIIAIAILLFFSGIISAAEAAFFALSPADVETLKSSNTKKDIRIIDLISKPRLLLATILISGNFVNIAIVILSTYITNNALPKFQNPILEFIVEVAAITLLILLLGEMIPKIYATQNALKATRVLIYPMAFLQKIAQPFASFLVASTSVIDKKIKRKNRKISMDELSHALELTSEKSMPAEDHKILKGVVRFGNTDVKQIMKPRMDVIAFEQKTVFTELLEKITDAGFSRVPVYKENLDSIVGILHIKDLIPFLNEKNNFNWQPLIRPAFFVPENKKIDDLLREFQYKKTHLAIVVDEYGGVSGIVTLEDVIEEIMGEINDEFDDDDTIYSKLDNNNYVFEGKILLNDFCRITNLTTAIFQENKGESDTLAGFLIELEGRIPRKNEKIIFENLIFNIESSDNRKIKRVKITINDIVTD